MKFKSFRIKNFKGIENLILPLDSSPKLNIHTLVGLNESGKTTILEAINYFGSRASASIFLGSPESQKADTQAFIPIGKVDNFKGTIDITAILEFEGNEFDNIKDEIFKEHDIKLANSFSVFSISIRNNFVNSVETSTDNIWNIEFLAKIGAQRKAKKLTGKEWQSCVSIIKKYIPEILYFPNFLFDFPDKIYLQPFIIPTKQYFFYKTLIQDILDSLNNSLDIKEHIIERISKGDISSKRQLTAVLLKMSGNVTALVFKSWNKIFNKQITKKEIDIEWGVDSYEEGEQKREAIYLQFLLRDGDSQYKISERSLGFRWFFVFLLLTQFRNNRARKLRKALYLFDEPASNLHSAAQTQLLASFDNVIYTTHSHHLVNPNWLENAYVVKNEGLDYDKEYDEFSSKNTKVTLFSYRSFVAKHPNQTTYFQPILDVLEYYPSKLESVPNVAITEGKNNYYSLSYLDLIINKASSINLLPGTGASKLDTPIQLYLAWGKNFIVILDSDKEGVSQKKRYLDDFGLSVSNKVFTLEDINPLWKDYSCENLFVEADKLKLIQSRYPDVKAYDKSIFNRSVQENLINKIDFSFSKETVSNFSMLLAFCKARLK